MYLSVVEIIAQNLLVVFVLVIAIVLLAVLFSGKSMSRLLLPRPVDEAVAKLLPRGLISDAAAKPSGEFQVQVKVGGKPQTVFVKRLAGATFAWAYDPTEECPASGSFAFTGLRHNLRSDSAISPTEVEHCIERALNDVMAAQDFQTAEVEEATIWIDIFGALEDEFSLDTIPEVFDESDREDWAAALRTALQHDNVGDVAIFARGSLLLHVLDSKSQRVLYRAATMFHIVVDVNEDERERRTREAITQMLQHFPPPKP